MSVRATEAWLEDPIRRYVDDARVELALLMNTSGQVLAQHGFSKSVDVMSACALAAAIHATAGELGRQMEGRAFSGSHYAGSVKQLHLGPIQLSRGQVLLLSVFDSSTSIGLVQIYFRELAEALNEADTGPMPEPVAGVDLERELGKSLAELFGGE